MDIKITDKALRRFLKTDSTPEELSKKISLCGPTFDRTTKIEGDYLYEIEVITNRIDTASAQGIARDAAAILKQQGIDASFINDPYQEKINLYPSLPKTFSFEIPNQKLTPRFVAVSFENIDIKESPLDTQKLLSSCGQRPINNVVDITNELTLLYGMPSHIFDLDKLGAQRLLIRESKPGEEVATLNGQLNKLQGGDIVIEDGAGRLVDLCGVMGGSVAEVDQYTKNILLIVPTYSPEKIRKTSLYLQNRTLAAQILEKQPDPELCLPVLMKAIELFEERANARVSSRVYNSNTASLSPKSIDLDTDWASNLIGINIPSSTIISILENLGFIVKRKSDHQITCTVPSWRYYDINIREDLVEEIARVNSYSKLLPTLPHINLAPEPMDPILKTESKIKNYLSCIGFSEIYNNSLISLEIIKKSELKETEHLKLTNSLSQDYEYLRTSLVPSILQNIKNNQGKTSEPYRLYELSNIYLPTQDKLPNEISKCVFTSTDEYRNVKGCLESLLCHLNVKKCRFVDPTNAPTYFIKENTAQIVVNNTNLGYIGLIKKTILHSFGITSNPIFVEIDIKNITSSISPSLIYEPISDFPEVVEQMTITSNERVGDIINKIHSCSNLINEISYSNSFKNKHTFKITFSSLKKNLTQSEVNDIKNNIQLLFN